MIMKGSSKWDGQLYHDSLDITNGSAFNIDDRNILLKRIDSLQEQLYSQGARLLKANSLREQDLRLLMG